jgi:hypothetical protein
MDHEAKVERLDPRHSSLHGHAQVLLTRSFGLLLKFGREATQSLECVCGPDLLFNPILQPQRTFWIKTAPPQLINATSNMISTLTFGSAAVEQGDVGGEAVLGEGPVAARSDVPYLMQYALEAEILVVHEVLRLII